MQSSKRQYKYACSSRSPVYLSIAYHVGYDEENKADKVVPILSTTPTIELHKISLIYNNTWNDDNIWKPLDKKYIIDFIFSHELHYNI